ncbi:MULTISPECIES: hypothetical protein [unclassified Pseudofrankia]|uniref:hypothetical protein n=1 Tax=unclassified Pseudofrankia TaxID=2994372 RepID=UPI0008D97421|nr:MULTISPECIES: hypothetical protein [unclassified Pseudofrankia]MDT3446229.1 hypothetical protein [Pseudofrankia sp. BMG5.37]OHV42451.1 hypothetical protein BCD48_31155 [Pseudofrankia sp. BMG5.36]
MQVDFLWQQGVVFLIGLAFSRGIWLVRTRILHRRARRFFGVDVSARGASVVLQVLHPLGRSNFDATTEQTTALKVLPDGRQARLPIYGNVLHLDDYQASQEVVELLREHRLPSSRLVADSDVLGQWAANPSAVCIGSPFVNAALAEAINATAGPDGPYITGDRPALTLDTYRVAVRLPDELILGVTVERAIGVIARLPNPACPQGWVIGIFGCRAEATYAAARYLHREFDDVLRWIDRDSPAVVLLAVEGATFGIVRPMYAATVSEVLFQRSELVAYYRRHEF